MVEKLFSLKEYTEMNRPTVAEIDLAALRYNVSRITRLSTNPGKMLAIVKANAYGHGAVHISRELVKCGIDYLGVAICEEAAELRHAGLQVPIMVMGGIYSGQEEAAIKYNLVPVIFDITAARSLNAIASQNGIFIKVHIKLDTGMGRIGIMPNDLDTFFQSLKACNNLVVDGLLTHLSAADASTENSDNFTCRQIDMFLSLSGRIRDMGFSPSFLHLANSAAIIRRLEPCFNLVRPGLMLYGISPSPQVSTDLKPVMSLKTGVIAIKRVPKGYSISYRRTFITQRESVIATLPIGYADGYSRQLSNRAQVIIHGCKAPVVGVVCMDMVMVDVTDIPDVMVNDEAILIGSQGGEYISARDLADSAQSIPYEILCGISSRVPRVYVHGV